MDLVQDVRDLPDGQDHFTGTLVLHERTGADTVHVVDGQQRLTTIIVLLDRIFRRLRSLGDDSMASRFEAEAGLGGIGGP